MGSVVVVVTILCITSIAGQSTTEEPLTVDAIVDKLKEMVTKFVPDKEKAEKFIEKIETARVCLNMTDGIRDDVMKKLVDSIIPTFIECTTSIKDLKEIMEKQSAVKACYEKKGQEFQESTGMTKEEIGTFQDIGKCIKEKAQL